MHTVRQALPGYFAAHVRLQQWALHGVAGFKPLHPSHTMASAEIPALLRIVMNTSFQEKNDAHDCCQCPAVLIPVNNSTMAL